MCIRDRGFINAHCHLELSYLKNQIEPGGGLENFIPQIISCLLYTSDAADERSSVDLGGRRIIKKKKISKIARAGRITIEILIYKYL